MRELIWKERHGGGDSPHVYYVLKEANKDENMAATVVLYAITLLWHISIWHENNWIEQDTEYTDLDEAKAVAVALAAMQEKDT